MVEALVFPTSLSPGHVLMKQRPTKIKDKLLPNRINLLDTHIPPVGCFQGTHVPSHLNCCLRMACSQVPAQKLLPAEEKDFTQITATPQSKLHIITNPWEGSGDQPPSSFQSLSEGCLSPRVPGWMKPLLHHSWTSPAQSSFCHSYIGVINKNNPQWTVYRYPSQSFPRELILWHYYISITLAYI